MQLCLTGQFSTIFPVIELCLPWSHRSLLCKFFLEITARTRLIFFADPECPSQITALINFISLICSNKMVPSQFKKWNSSTLPGDIPQLSQTWAACLYVTFSQLLLSYPDSVPLPFVCDWFTWLNLHHKQWSHFQPKRCNNIHCTCMTQISPTFHNILWLSKSVKKNPNDEACQHLQQWWAFSWYYHNYILFRWLITLQKTVIRRYCSW